MIRVGDVSTDRLRQRLHKCQSVVEWYELPEITEPSRLIAYHPPSDSDERNEFAPQGLAIAVRVGQRLQPFSDPRVDESDVVAKIEQPRIVQRSNVAAP